MGSWVQRWGCYVTSETPTTNRYFHLQNFCWRCYVLFFVCYNRFYLGLMNRHVTRVLQRKLTLILRKLFTCGNGKPQLPMLSQTLWREHLKYQLERVWHDVLSESAQLWASHVVPGIFPRVATRHWVCHCARPWDKEYYTNSMFSVRKQVHNGLWYREACRRTRATEAEVPAVSSIFLHAAVLSVWCYTIWRLVFLFYWFQL